MNVEASASEHTITVRFESDTLDMEGIVQALNHVGYTVGEAELLTSE